MNRRSNSDILFAGQVSNRTSPVRCLPRASCAAGLTAFTAAGDFNGAIMRTIDEEFPEVRERPKFAWDGELPYGSETKQRQHDRVLAFFRANHERKRMRFFGLPGAEWTFEKMLEAEFRGAEFACLEREWGILEYGMRHMPGKRHHTRLFQTGAGAISGAQSSNAIVMGVDFSDFVFYGSRKAGGGRSNKESTRQWCNLWKRNTAVWIDGQSTVGSPMTAAISRIGNYCDMHTLKVPFAYTFMLGRDAPGTLDDRVDILNRFLCSGRYRSFELCDSWGYEGHGGCAMAMMMGLLVKKEPDFTAPTFGEYPHNGD